MAIRVIIPVVAGKGGVGKSTVAVNLACALAKREGAKVALVDCDIYGPSVPTLMGGGKLQLDHENRPIPAEKYGVKYMSIGFFLKDPDAAVMWRGPMLHKVVTQMFADINWGEVDYCIVDMPPGTGDVQISLSQVVQVTGAVVVTTPQEVALADVRKAMNMLRHVNTPILGVVENMSYYTDRSGQRVELFGNGGGAKIAASYDVPLLAQLPLEMSIREGGDAGTPIALDETSAGGREFAALAAKIVEIVDRQVTEQQPVSIIND